MAAGSASSAQGERTSEAVELVQRRGGIDREAKFEHFAAGVLVDQAARRSEGDDLRLVHDDQAITELLRLIHVVGR